MSLEIHFDYSNTAVICRVAEISPPASTTTTPHLDSRTLGTILTVEENQEDDDPEDDDTW